jgi:hypothetical protein
MKEQDEIEELFSSTFTGFEKVPPLDVKAAIDAKIFAKGPTTKRKFGYFWIFPSLLLITLLVIIGVRSAKTVENDELNLAVVDSSVAADNQGTSKRSEQEMKSSTDEIKDAELTKPTSTLNQNTPSNITSTSTSSTSSNKGERTVSNYNSSNSQVQHSSKTTSNSLNKGQKNSSKQSFNGSVKKKEINTSSKGKLNTSKSNLNKYEELNTVSDLQTAENSSDSKNVQSAGSTDQAFKSGTDQQKQSNLEDSTSHSNEMAAAVEKKDTTNPALPTLSPKIDTPPVKKVSPWLLAFYAGGTYGTSILKYNSIEKYVLTEKVGYAMSLEAHYALNTRVGIAAGLDFNSRNESFIQTTTTIDSVFTGITTEYIYNDPIQQDSIIDTLYYANYDIQSNEVEKDQQLKHLSFAVPVFVKLNLYQKGNWNLDLDAGLRFAYVKNSLVSNDFNLDAPQFKSFAIRANLRPQIVYKIGAIGLGAYVNAGFDLIPAVQWNGVKRNRIDYGAGIMLRYQL